MELFGLIRTGLIAAVPVAIACALFIWARASAIHEEVDSGLQVVGFFGHNPIAWIGVWATIAFVFGIGASWVYDYMLTNWNWGSVQYFAIAAILCIGLSLLGFLRIYNGQEHPFRYEWIGLNSAFALGFGYLIPKLVG